MAEDSNQYDFEVYQVEGGKGEMDTLYKRIVVYIYR